MNIPKQIDAFISPSLAVFFSKIHLHSSVHQVQRKGWKIHISIKTLELNSTFKFPRNSLKPLPYQLSSNLNKLRSAPKRRWSKH